MTKAKKETAVMSIVPEVQALENLFDAFNEAFFESALSRPVITFNTDITKGAYGWFSTDTVWTHTRDGGKSVELNICCDRVESPAHVAKTLLHEMVHLYNFVNGIKDYSRAGTYHNTKFRDAALEHGLTCEQSLKYGWSNCSLTAAAEDVASIYYDDFNLKREEANAKKITKSKRSSTRKYECPCCGVSVRATKAVRIRCDECDELMECDEE